MTTPGRIMVGPPGAQPTASMEGWTQVGYITGPLNLTRPLNDTTTPIRTLTKYHGIVHLRGSFTSQWREVLSYWADQPQRISAMHTAYRAKTRRRNRKRK